MLAERKRERRQGRLGEKEKADPQERECPKENSQTLVTCGSILGIIAFGTAKRMVLRWIRGRLLNLFHISVQSV